MNSKYDCMGDVMNRFTLFAIAILLPTLLSATIIHVPYNYANLQNAIYSASDGDTVLVDHGIYYGGFDFAGRHITLASHFLLTGNDADIEATILDGGDEMVVLTIANLEVTDAAVIGFTVMNGLGVGDWPNVHAGGIDVINSSVWIDHCYVHDNESIGGSNRGAGIYYGSANGGLISYCKIWENLSYMGAGITFRNDSNGVWVKNCEVFQNGLGVYGDGITVPYSDNIHLSKCKVWGNGDLGIMWGMQSGGSIDNCTVVNNMDTGLWFRDTDGPSLTISNSIIFGNEGYEQVSVYSGNWDHLEATFSLIGGVSDEPWFGQGCIDTDPMFRNPELADYRLMPDSPCIDTGDPDSPWDPDGTPPDMGAIPYQVAEFAITPSVYRIPSAGGVVAYDATVTSNFTQGSEVNYWTEVVTVGGVVFGPLEEDMVYVPPMSEITLAGRTQAVPAWVPAGIYTLRAYIGRPYQVEFQLMDEFIFTKGAYLFGGVGLSNADDWFNDPQSPTLTANEFGSDHPLDYDLSAIYPNPFNSATTVCVSLPMPGNLTVAVYNTAGQRVAMLHDGSLGAGIHNLSFDASHLASGLYFVQAVVAGEMNQVQKVLLVR